MMYLRMGKRIHLCDYETHGLVEAPNLLFDRIVEIPRMKEGKRQIIETLINEESLLFEKFLRHERETWIPRTGAPWGS